MKTDHGGDGSAPSCFTDPLLAVQPIASRRQRMVLKLAAELDRPFSASELMRMTKWPPGPTTRALEKLLRDGYLAEAGPWRTRGVLERGFVITAEGKLVQTATEASLITELTSTVEGERLTGPSCLAAADVANAVTALRALTGMPK